MHSNELRCGGMLVLVVIMMVIAFIPLTIVDAYGASNNVVLAYKGEVGRPVEGKNITTYPAHAYITIKMQANGTILVEEVSEGIPPAILMITKKIYLVESNSRKIVGTEEYVLWWIDPHGLKNGDKVKILNFTFEVVGTSSYFVMNMLRRVVELRHIDENGTKYAAKYDEKSGVLIEYRIKNYAENYSLVIILESAYGVELSVDILYYVMLALPFIIVPAIITYFITRPRLPKVGGIRSEGGGDKG
ncbi:MAG: hypothetical protein ACTSXJ_05250 [Candidatus Baldrarchaeia archaeon]